MLSMAVHAGINGAFTHTPLPLKPSSSFKPFKGSSVSFKPKTPSTHSSMCLDSKKHRHNSREVVLYASAASAEAVVEEIGGGGEEEVTSASDDSELSEETQKLGVVVKPIEKPRLVLKFIWLEKNIGLALDQLIPGYGTIPLSPYYFWPRKDAWEELKTTLESKPWISQKRMIILLNQATDIINLWQQSGGNLS